MKVFTVLAVLLVAGFHGNLADDEGEARLLASKNILNQYLVEDKDLTVEYKIFNIGGRYTTVNYMFTICYRLPFCAH